MKERQLLVLNVTNVVDINADLLGFYGQSRVIMNLQY